MSEISRLLKVSASKRLLLKHDSNPLNSPYFGLQVRKKFACTQLQLIANWIDVYYKVTNLILTNRVPYSLNRLLAEPKDVMRHTMLPVINLLILRHQKRVALKTAVSYSQIRVK